MPTTTRTLAYFLLMATFSATMIAAQHTRGATKSNDHFDHHDTDQDAGRDISNILKKYHNVVIGVGTFLGFVFTFVGYKLFPATMFLCGSVAGGFSSYLLTNNLVSDDYENKIAILIGVSSVCGLIGGLLACKLRKLGVFLAGASGGVVGAFPLFNIALSSIQAPPSMPNLYLYIAVSVLGLAAGLLALKLKRPIIIIATSSAGAFCATYGTKYFIELSGDVPVTTWSSPLVWAYVGGFATMFIAGVLIQFKTTKKITNDTSRDYLLSEQHDGVVYPAPRMNEGLPAGAMEKKHVVNFV